MKMAFLSKVVYKFNVIAVKMIILFFTEVDKILKICMEAQKRPQIAKAILNKKSIDEGIIPYLMPTYIKQPQ